MSHPVIARRHAERRAAIQRVQRWASRLAGGLDICAVVVVGSVARGDFNKWSDTDVLVIAEDLPSGPRARLALLQHDAPVGVQPVAWTEAEFTARLQRRDPLAVEAMGVGVVVHGRLPHR